MLDSDDRSGFLEKESRNLSQPCTGTTHRDSGVIRVYCVYSIVLGIKYRLLKDKLLSGILCQLLLSITNEIFYDKYNSKDKSEK